jgi:hypothetical protein
MALVAAAVIKGARSSELTSHAMLVMTAGFVVVLAVEVVLLFFAVSLRDDGLEGTLLGVRLWLMPYGSVLSVRRTVHPTLGILPVDLIEHRKAGQIVRFPLLLVSRNDEFLRELRARVDKSTH